MRSVAYTGPRLAASKDAYDQWFVKEAEAIHGLKMTDMPKTATPQLGFEWGHTRSTVKGCMALVAPVSNVEKWWAWCHELAVRHHVG